MLTQSSKRLSQSNWRLLQLNLHSNTTENSDEKMSRSLAVILTTCSRLAVLWEDIVMSMDAQLLDVQRAPFNVRKT